jgi:hypothetical protein
MRSCRRLENVDAFDWFNLDAEGVPEQSTGSTSR